MRYSDKYHRELNSLLYEQLHDMKEVMSSLRMAFEGIRDDSYNDLSNNSKMTVKTAIELAKDYEEIQQPNQITNV